MSAGGSKTSTDSTANTNQTQTQDLSQQQRINPFLAKRGKKQIRRIDRLLAGDEYQDPSLYPGLGDITRQGLMAKLGQAQQGLQIPQATMDQYLATVRGDYMDPESNPYLRNATETAALRAEQGVNSRYGRGRFGSGAFANAIADSRNEIYNQAYSNAYERERARNIDAIRFAPMLAQMETADADTAIGIGSVFDQDAAQRWEWPLRREAYRTGQYTGNPLAQERYIDTQGTVNTVGATIGSSSARQKNDFNWMAALGALTGAAGGAIGGMGG